MLGWRRVPIPFCIDAVLARVLSVAFLRAGWTGVRHRQKPERAFFFIMKARGLVRLVWTAST